VLSGGAVALGHGFAGVGSQALNLEDEAKEFAEAFGRQSQLVLQAGPEDVSRALHGTKTVFISCHGNLVSTDWGDKFLLCLADGGHEPEDLIHDGVAAPLIILSACTSGVYEMALGDYPVGAAPTFLLAGAKFCICTRFPISAHFAKAFFPTLGRLLGGGHSLGRAFATSLLEMEAHGQDIWRHLACVELLGRGISDPKFDHDHFLP
jgi:hypothetical protein